MTAEKQTCAQALIARGIDIDRARKLSGLNRASYYRPEQTCANATQLLLMQ